MIGASFYQIIHDVIAIFGMGSLMAFSMMVLWQSPWKRLNQLVFIWMLATSLGLVHAYIVAWHARNGLIYNGLDRLFLAGYTITPSLAYSAISLVIIEVAKLWTSKTRRIVGVLILLVSIANIVNGVFFASNAGADVTFNMINGYPVITGDIAVSQALIGVYTFGIALLNAYMTFVARHRLHRLVIIGISINTAWLFLFPFPLLTNFVAIITVISTLLICYGIFIDTVFFPIAAQNELLKIQQTDLEKTYASSEARIQQGTMDLELQVTRNQELREQLDHLLSREVRLGWMKSTIIKMVAQEFEEPLDVIREKAPRLAEQVHSLDATTRNVQTEIVRDSIAEITGLLDEVVEVERAKALPEPEYQTITLDALATHLSKEVFPTRLAEPNWYRFILGDPDATVSVPLHYVSQISAILIEKLYKATKETVEVSLEHTPTSELLLTITNRQIDPPLGSHSQLLELVVRANESRAFSGLTLGVYLINRYINQLDSKLTLTAIRNNTQGVLNVLFPSTPVA